MYFNIFMNVIEEIRKNLFHMYIILDILSRYLCISHATMYLNFRQTHETTATLIQNQLVFTQIHISVDAIN